MSFIHLLFCGSLLINIGLLFAYLIKADNLDAIKKTLANTLEEKDRLRDIVKQFLNKKD